LISTKKKIRENSSFPLSGFSTGTHHTFSYLLFTMHSHIYVLTREHQPNKGKWKINVYFESHFGN